MTATDRPEANPQGNADTPSVALDRALAGELERRAAADLLRRRPLVDSGHGPVMRIDGRRVINFCGNDYLGLASAPAGRQALRQASRTGVGAGASHLINGHHRAHHRLEDALAEFVGRPRALLFSSGYLANLGVISALVGRGDWVFQDRLNHACLLDGAVLSRAPMRRYRHCDVQDLQGRLAASAGRRRLVVSDGVFSMDGDLAPLPKLAAACRDADAWLMIDDAHGLGVLGPRGRGSCEHFGMTRAEVPILVGTLGKAFGGSGAFVAASETVIEYLIQTARPYIYTTAMPAPVAAATAANVARAVRESWRRARLHAWIQRFRSGARELGIPLLPSDSAIQPVPIGEAADALAASQSLLQHGLFVMAIRPPTVPRGTARLRITLSARHRASQIDRLLEVLDRTLPPTTRQAMPRH